MKSVFMLMIAILILAVFPYSYAADGEEKEHSCVYSYIVCKDNCEYYQESESLKFCKHSCDKKFPCRPKLKQQHSAESYY